MRSLIALALSLPMAACVGPINNELGPQTGPWLVDQAERWFCVNQGLVCSPPAYFSPPPEDLVVHSGGVLEWVDAVSQTGNLETACIRVPAGTEEGVARTEVTFCNLVDGTVVNETRGFAMIGWAPGTPDACTCSAHLDFVAE